ncbi:prophage LambdaSa2, Cro/CI family transcriptional regulator [Streptococcus pneumoniae]|nr:prophage LambdaSa2, Cro/CI family transcriptional regulator [Streptococcus pneumoniae]
MEELKKKVNAVYNWTVEDGKPQPPLYERGGYPSIKQIEMIAKTYDVNPAWLVGWIDDETKRYMGGKVWAKRT